MKFDMVMPKMGESITEGTIIKWLKKIGDTVDKDEIILEISTDKVDSEIPTPVAGKISGFLANEGDTVDVGTVIAQIETDEEVNESAKIEPVSKQIPAPDKPLPSPVTPSVEVQKPVIAGNRFYSPVVLSIARDKGILKEELDQIQGTGINGRVSKKDILNYIETRVKAPATEPTIAEIPSTRLANLPINGERIVIEPMDHIRKKIAEHMVKTVQTSAHVAIFTEVDMNNIYKIRERNKNSFFQKEGIKLTYLPFISEVVARTLKEFPYVNSSIEGDNILVKHFVNLGIAVATEKGLIVPVIKNTDSLNIVGFARVINDMAQRARNKKLIPDDVSEGTFSISNFGVYGTTIGFPLINQPQVGILGIGALQKRAVVINDAIAIRPMMNISLTFDHRLIDGEMGSKFLQRVSQLLMVYDSNTII